MSRRERGIMRAEGKVFAYCDVCDKIIYSSENNDGVTVQFAAFRARDHANFFQAEPHAVRVVILDKKRDCGRDHRFPAASTPIMRRDLDD